MRAVFYDPAAVDRNDAIGLPHGGEPVSDDEHRAPLGDLLHVGLNDPLADVIERARRLIEDQDARVGDQGAGDRDALPLPARQARAALADDRVVGLRHLEDEVVRAGELGGGDDLLNRHRRVGQRDVVAH